jgi:hypothetical protein
LASAPEPNSGRVTPGISKEYDGHNFLYPLTGGIPNAFNGDWTAGQIMMALPSAEVDPEQTGVVRWTAPRAMNVEVDGALWRASLPLGAIDSRLLYSVRKNGVEIANGTVDELGFNSAGGDTNAHTPETFSLSNIAVAQGDNLELRVKPMNQESVSTTADFDMNTNSAAIAVNAADLAKWTADFGNNAGSDADFDGDSDGADFLAWQRQFNTNYNLYVGLDFDINETAASITARSGAVPEPSSFGLLLLAATGMWRRHRVAHGLIR